MRSRYKIYNSSGVYFVTSSIVDWIDVFTTPSDFQILIDSINYNITNKDLIVHSYALMKNHFHLICKSENLVDRISSIKSFTAKTLLEKFHDDKNEEMLNKFREGKKDFKSDRQFQIW